jgi:hypothetical protein
MDYGARDLDCSSRGRVAEGARLGRRWLQGADQGSREWQKVWGRNHGGCEVRPARWGGKSARVAEIVNRGLLTGNDALDRLVCLCLYHGENPAACACRGFCDVWRHWRFSTGLSTPDSNGIQPCKLLERHRVRKGE